MNGDGSGWYAMVASLVNTTCDTSNRCWEFCVMWLCHVYIILDCLIEVTATTHVIHVYQYYPSININVIGKCTTKVAMAYIIIKIFLKLFTFVCQSSYKFEFRF